MANFAFPRIDFKTDTRYENAIEPCICVPDRWKEIKKKTIKQKLLLETNLSIFLIHFHQ